MYDFNDGQYITFRGISSETYNLRLLNLRTEVSSLNKISGIKRQVEEDDTNSYESQFLRIKNNKQDFSFELVKASKDDIGLSFTENEMKRIKRWLCVDNGYNPLKVHGYTYDVVFVDLEDSLINAQGQGSIILTVHTLDGLKHGNYLVQDIINKHRDSYRIEKFTANFTVGVSMDTTCIITQLDEDEGDIILENLTNKSKVIVKGLKYKEQAKIISKTGEIYSIQDEDNNLFANVTTNDSKLFTINYGFNKVKLSGLSKAQVSFRPNYVW